MAQHPHHNLRHTSHVPNRSNGGSIVWLENIYDVRCLTSFRLGPHENWPVTSFQLFRGPSWIHAAYHWQCGWPVFITLWKPRLLTISNGRLLSEIHWTNSALKFLLADHCISENKPVMYRASVLVNCLWEYVIAPFPICSNAAVIDPSRASSAVFTFPTASTTSFTCRCCITSLRSSDCGVQSSRFPLSFARLGCTFKTWKCFPLVTSKMGSGWKRASTSSWTFLLRSMIKYGYQQVDKQRSYEVHLPHSQVCHSFSLVLSVIEVRVQLVLMSWDIVLDF